MIIVPLSYYSIVTGIGQCAVTEISATPAGAPGRVCLHVPGEIAWDECDCGSFTQSAGVLIPSDNSRDQIPVIGDANNGCGPRYLGIEVTALVLRCAPSPLGDNLAPTCTALDTASRQWHYDAFAMRHGIICCLQTLLTAGSIESFTVVSHVPVGPQGGCVGSQLVYRFWLENCGCG